jgi:tellurite resistance-related uncharacterized protein
VDRPIIGFHQDDVGDWVAELSCLHVRHIRHEPPFIVAPWILDGPERSARIGALLECPLCDRTELPEGLEVQRSTPTWSGQTMPGGLRRDHRIAAGMWGVLCVEAGEVRFIADCDPPIDVIVRPDAPQPIPPEVPHRVEADGAARLHIDFLDRPHHGT